MRRNGSLRRKPGSGLSQAGLKRQQPTEGGRPTVGPLTPSEWRTVVFARYRHRSPLSGRRAEECHHVVPAQILKRDGLWHLLYHPDNGLPLTRQEHARHELAIERIARTQLPACAVEFAEKHGYGWLIDRYYA